MPNIFDNIEKQLMHFLRDTAAISYRGDFCVGYFNLRGWKHVSDQVDAWSGGDENACRLLVGMQKMPEEVIKESFETEDGIDIDNAKAIKLKKQLAEDFRKQLTIGVPIEADEKALQKLAQQIKDKKVVVKLYLRHTLHAKLYLFHRNDQISPLVGYLGSSNLTFSGLLKQGELNVDVIEQDAAQKLYDWFEARWNDRWCLDISDELVEIIENSWASEDFYQPYHIYLKMAYHLSREARAGLNEFKIPKDFKNDLFEFQIKAVLIAAHHLNKRGGVLIGDVVGLGKTMTATAIAKIFEDDFGLETLIICPKNLEPMWDDYVYRYGIRAKIIPLSMVQSQLPGMRRYRVVIIDESHNLRNRQGKRYRAIQEYIQLNASKVILLTATPYNKGYLDLSNQLRLFIDDEQDLGIMPERAINHEGGKVKFNAKHQVLLSSLKAFEQSTYNDDWRELMRLYLVRRTRSFIKDNYAEIDEENNRKYLYFADGTKSYFPERIPKKLEYHFSTQDPEDQYAKLYSEEVVNRINSLELPRYGLANYLRENIDSELTDKEKVIQDNLSRAGKRLMGFARTNLFKRLESSGHSFLLSINRHILRNYIYIYAIKEDKALPIGSQEASALDEYFDEIDLENYSNSNNNNSILTSEEDFLKAAGAIYERFATEMKNRFDWIRSSLFKPSLKNNLEFDSHELLKILKLGKDWNPRQDSQLNALLKLCKEEYPKDKILIFTQFADTAKYLHEQFKHSGIKELAVVTGDSENPTNIAYRFSPVSNEKSEIKGTADEIRVLFSTDVLSEGQNLQDAHIVVNYDLPWAIIRIIQRAGRVDRIGQKAEEIYCYSVLPEEGVEQIIRLRGRLRNRIEQNAEVVGSDEVFFEGDPVNIQDLYNEKSGILDDEEDGEIDLASYAYQIWKNATDKDPSLKKKIPELSNVIYSTKGKKEEEQDEGVIVYARTYDDNDLLAMVGKSSEIITQSQLRILKTADCEPNEKPIEKIENHHQLVQEGLEYIKVAESKLGGQLGKKTGARYRVYQRLYTYYEDNKDTLFVNEPLKKAVEDIYKNPLKEFARDTFNRQLKAGASDEDLANLAVSLREEDKLCITENEEVKFKEPQIICSLGIKENS